MKILAIDTSSTACSVALLMNDKTIASHRIAPMQQTQLILTMIDEILSSAGISLRELDALAFGCGPGSFTGVRIATSVAQGLGFAADIPLISVSSLAAVAQSAYLDLGWRNLLVGVDARIQEVYWGAYQVNQDGLVALVGVERVCAPQEVSAPDTKEWYGVGSAWQVYGMPVKPVAQDGTCLPKASAILPLAIDKYRKQEWITPSEAVPTYLRNNVAKKSS